MYCGELWASVFDVYYQPPKWAHKKLLGFCCPRCDSEGRAIIYQKMPVLEKTKDGVIFISASSE
jgi:hypothetical protein